MTKRPRSPATVCNLQTATTPVDAQRQEYALRVAEFNMKYHTNLSATKKNIVAYDPKTGTVGTIQESETVNAWCRDRALQPANGQTAGEAPVVKKQSPAKLSARPVDKFSGIALR